MKTRTSLQGKGFTLIEVLVSFVIVAIGMASILALQISSVKVDSKNLRMDDAMRTAEAELDRLRQMSRDNTSFFTTDQDKSYTVQSIDPDPDHTRTYTALLTDDKEVLFSDNATDWVRKDLSLTLRWTERIGPLDNQTSATKRITLSTYIVGEE